MSRFFLDVFNGHGISVDDEGVDAETVAALAAITYDSIRSMVAEDARQGIINLMARSWFATKLGPNRPLSLSRKHLLC